jgi:hypothetical protein
VSREIGSQVSRVGAYHRPVFHLQNQDIACGV